MFRLIRMLTSLTFLLTVGGGVYLWISRVPFLEHYLTKKLGITVYIDDVTLGLNTVTLSNFRLESPERSPFSVSKLRLDLPFTNFFHQELHIERLRLQSPQVRLELLNLVGSDSNWSHILCDLPSTKTRPFSIDKLIVTNLRFEVTRSTGRTLKVPPLPYLELNSLGENRSLTLPQISHVLFQTMLSTLTTRPYMGSILDNIPPPPQENLLGVTSSIPFKIRKGPTNYLHDLLQKIFPYR